MAKRCGSFLRTSKFQNMFIGKPKPTVTPDDKDWIEQAFIWFFERYSSIIRE